MGEVELVKDLLSLDQDVLPNEDGIIPSFGVEKVKSLHHYYGNPDQDTRCQHLRCSTNEMCKRFTTLRIWWLEKARYESTA